MSHNSSAYSIRHKSHTHRTGVVSRVMDELRRRALQREKLEQEATAEQEEEEDVPQEEEELLEVDDPLVEIPVGHKKYDKRMNVLRRTNCETALAFMIHLCLLIYCTGVNVYDSTAFKRCKDRDMVFVGHDTFGWRFKYLTFLTMVTSHVIIM